MTKSDMEKYYFYRLYLIDFDAVKHTIGVLKCYKRNDIRFCLLRDLVVCYSRPFSGNKGEHIHKHYMPESFVPKHLRSLHKELLTVRNQLFAHHDYTYRKPKIADWSTSTRKIFPMSFRGYDYGKLDARLAEIKELVNLVSENLKREIDNIEKYL